MLDYKDFQDIDFKLHLLSGSSIKLGNLVITPYVLNEIKAFGFNNYMTSLQLMMISIDDFITSIEDEDKKAILEEQRAKLKAFDFYVAFGGEELQQKLIDSLKMVFKTNDVMLLDDGVIGLDFMNSGIIKEIDGRLVVDNEMLQGMNEDEIKVVHRDNFDDIVEIIKLQNYLQKPNEIGRAKELNAVDEATRELMLQMERNRKIVEDKKKAQKQADGDDDDIDISDIISAVGSKSNSINKLNIWDFTLYQIYDEYSRLELIDSYDFSIRAMMAGAEKVEVKHWSSRI